MTLPFGRKHIPVLATAVVFIALFGTASVLYRNFFSLLVFTNLLENAAEAMGGDGVIAIGGLVRNGTVEVTVRDSGPGIPPDLHERIFEFSFSRRGTSRTARLGLGLWWVKTLMVRLGGSVAVESDGQAGTAFRIRMPCTESVS